MGKKSTKTSAGVKKLEKKIESAPEKTYGKSYPAPNPQARAKGVIVHEGESRLVKAGNKPAIEASDDSGELRTFPVPGNKLKNFNKNVTRAESRAKAFMNETVGRPLEENK
jgi:hypothetical protein